MARICTSSLSYTDLTMRTPISQKDDDEIKIYFEIITYSVPFDRHEDEDIHRQYIFDLL